MGYENEIGAFARSLLQIEGSYDISVKPLSARGSDRMFYRVLWNDRTAIAIKYDTNRTENGYYADIANYLQKMRIPVPGVITHDPEKNIIMMEDLGDTDLCSMATRQWPERRILYQKTLGAIRRLHRITEKNFSPASIRLMDGFDPDLYRWEQDYFLDNFVKGYCDLALDPGFEMRLRAELSALSERLQSVPRSLVHRDLQSRNIMVCNGEPYFIDFQGMRLGNPFYDLASLLLDPYVHITDEAREELLSFSYVLSSQEPDWDAYQNSFWEAGAERLMQALGAFGFLGKVKGLQDFLGSIPSGLDNLNLAVSRVPSLGCLREVILLCRMTIE